MVSKVNPISSKVLPRGSLVSRKPDVKNPFLCTTSFARLPWYQKLKIILMVPIGILRFTGFVVTVLVGCLFGNLAILNYKRKEVEEPFTGMRRSMQKAVIGCARIALFFCGFHWVTVKGKVAKWSEAPILVMAPHTSFCDAFVVAFTGVITAVSRQENQEVFMLGNVFKALQPILVARTERGSKNYTIKEIQRRAKSDGIWPPVLIFPEGTCTNGQCLITFKPGAFYPGLPVQPVILRYKNKLDVTSWTWTGPPLLEQFLLLFCQIHNHLEIEFLPVYKPSYEESQDAKFFARNVRATMARALEIPTTEHAFEDCNLMVQARKNHLPMETGVIEYQKLHQHLGMDLNSMKELMKTFAAMDRGGNGQVTMEDFAKYLKLPNIPEVDALFRIYDRDDSGYIDFREYIIGLSLVSQPLNSEETIELAFSIFDVDQSGVVTEQGLKQILQSALPRITDLDARCIFKFADKNNKGVISYDEFREFSLSHPEYAVLFTHFHHLKTMESNNESPTGQETYPVQDMVLPNAAEPVKS